MSSYVGCSVQKPPPENEGNRNGLVGLQIMLKMLMDGMEECKQKLEHITKTRKDFTNLGGRCRDWLRKQTSYKSK
jgi:hypothetical protein